MKDAKQKKLTYRLIAPAEPYGLLIHEMIVELVRAHHDDLRSAKISVAWHLSRKPDQDGRMSLGTTKLVGNLERELMDPDFIIVLVKEFWDDAEVKDEQRRALLDHQLSRVALLLDKEGEPVEDERGRKCYRLVKPDLQEFSSVVERHGMYRAEIERFWQSLKHAEQRNLFERDKPETPQALAADR